MSLSCALRAIFAGLVSAVAIGVVLRCKPALPAAVARLGTRTFGSVSLLWPGGKKGALITRIDAGSPAEKAGLKTDDVIIRFAGHRVRNAEQLRKLADAAGSGTAAQIDVLREGRMQCLNVMIGTPPFVTMPIDPSSHEAE